jgi:hypothetical protein
MEEAVATKRAKRSPKQQAFMKPPASIPEINRWLVFGLDPSLSRTGYALMEITRQPEGLKSRWLAVGSVQPNDASAPIWIRSRHIAMGLLATLHGYRPQVDEVRSTGLIISMEYPTPQNDYLVALNRMIHREFFDSPGVPFERTDVRYLVNNFATSRVLLTNASTLRSLMGLKMRGSSNKKENIAKAYDYINQDRFPNLDTDSCDAVLLAMMGKYTANLLLDATTEIPPAFALTLTNGAQEIKGKGSRSRVITKGILHRPEYWYEYSPSTYSLVYRDARVKTRVLDRRQAVL